MLQVFCCCGILNFPVKCLLETSCVFCYLFSFWCHINMIVQNHFLFKIRSPHCTIMNRRSNNRYKNKNFGRTHFPQLSHVISRWSPIWKAFRNGTRMEKYDRMLKIAKNVCDRVCDSLSQTKSQWSRTKNHATDLSQQFLGFFKSSHTIWVILYDSYTKMNGLLK